MNATRLRIILMLAFVLGSLMAQAQQSPRTAEAVALINRAIGADYDEQGALALIAESKTLDVKTQALIKGITEHNLAWFGQEEFTKRAIETLAALKDDPLGLMYYGSSITVVAQYAIKRKDVGVASAKSQEGLAIIAKAMKLDPSSLQLHVLRLMNGIEISRQSPFKQYDLIKEDVDFLLAELAKPNALDKSLKAMILLSVGDYYFDTKKITAALGYYDKAIREAPKSRAALKAKKHLANLEG